MLASFVFCKICFVQLCELWTMSYELLIAMSERINHVKNWPVQSKNKSECIWKLLGDVLGRLKSVPEPVWSLLGFPWEHIGRVLAAVERVLEGSKSILGGSWRPLDASK